MPCVSVVARCTFIEQGEIAMIRYERGPDYLDIIWGDKEEVIIGRIDRKGVSSLTLSCVLTIDDLRNLISRCQSFRDGLWEDAYRK